MMYMISTTKIIKRVSRKLEPVQANDLAQRIKQEALEKAPNANPMNLKEWLHNATSVSKG